jgi:6-pyruvoyltetrahydropterin/6-carboxytetrahydropterin synthase
MAYYSTKTYGHERGLSCAFRQPRAFHSHCKFIHGYSLSFSFKFGASELDDKNWVVDFGGLKDLKNWLEDNFDHKLAVDRADPLAVALCDLETKGLAEIVLMDGVGCEKFAEHAFNFASNMINEKYGDRCWVESVEVREHGANSGIYVREQNGK